MTLVGVCAGLHSLSIASAAEIKSGSPESFRRSPTSRLTIHEWGTFTALQDEQGHAIPGINTDDQPLPDFVHRLADFLLIPANELAPIFYKGAPMCHPDVTMRLETPVVYFYPPVGAELPMRTTVRASFREGWLTEYYPNAAVDAPGVQKNSFSFGPLNPSVRGKLEWRDLVVGREPNAPATDFPVWLAPRAVNSAGVATVYPTLAATESERYLFYRGVAHLNAPLRVVHSFGDGQLQVRPQIDERLGLKKALTVRALWLVDVQTDGTVAYRAFPSVTLTGSADQVLAKAPAQFKDAEFSKPNFENLLQEMQAALVQDGLFEDEARALLNTWQQAYFKSPGLRLFFLVPTEWTESVLSLESSIPADFHRSMVGRIELVSAEQRDLLAQFASMPISTSSQIWEIFSNPSISAETSAQLRRGDKTIAELGLTVPRDYKAYLDLGRFRNALILDELRQRPTPGLSELVKQYGLGYFQMP